VKLDDDEVESEPARSAGLALAAGAVPPPVGAVKTDTLDVRGDFSTPRNVTEPPRGALASPGGPDRTKGTFGPETGGPGCSLLVCTSVVDLFVP
jgi:hypothetical protein